MPIYLRNFYFRELADQKKKENEQQAAQNRKIKNSYKKPKRTSRYPGKV